VSRKDLEHGDIVAWVDSREQLPLDLLLRSERRGLKCGDYTIAGLQDIIVVERKSLADAVMCAGRERDRFDACIKRMKGYEVRALVIEASWADIEAGAWRSQLKPSQLKAALYSWSKHVSIFPAGDRKTAAAVVSGILFSAARERWRELGAYFETLKIDTNKREETA
jgi:DNA excision repair protein ERCC-4